MKNRKLLKNLRFGIAYLLLIGIGLCSRLVSEYYENKSQYEIYVASLQEASLHNTSLAKEWLLAGEKAFQESRAIQLPYSESIHFYSDKPQSKGYTFNCKSNQKIKLKAYNSSEGKVFTDLFVLENNNWKQVAEMDSLGQLLFHFKNDTKCILRIQPELLTHSKYTVSLKSINNATDLEQEIKKVAFY